MFAKILGFFKNPDKNPDKKIEVISETEICAEESSAEVEVEVTKPKEEVLVQTKVVDEITTKEEALNSGYKFLKKKGDKEVFIKGTKRILL